MDSHPISVTVLKSQPLVFNPAVIAHGGMVLGDARADRLEGELSWGIHLCIRESCCPCCSEAASKSPLTHASFISLGWTSMESNFGLPLVLCNEGEAQDRVPRS